MTAVNILIQGIISHVGTAGQLADIFTKALGRLKFVEMRSALGVVEVQQV
jgi:hypothetical protein